MERHFHEELEKLNTNLLKIAALTEEAIHQSIEALQKRDKDLARSVIENDKVIDELENTIDEETVGLLALFQPMARDLRFVMTGMKVATELERIADLTVNISQRAIDLAGQPVLKPLIDIPKLAENAKKMVHGAMDAFVKRDELLAEEVIVSDKVSNELRTLITQELINDYMMKDGSTVPRAVALLLVTRDLERISDCATAIAEDVIYMIKAKIVKHHLDQLIFVYKKVKE